MVDFGSSGAQAANLHISENSLDFSTTRKRTTLEHMLHMFLRNRIVNKAYLID